MVKRVKKIENYENDSLNSSISEKTGIKLVLKVGSTTASSLSDLVGSPENSLLDESSFLEPPTSMTMNTTMNTTEKKKGRKKKRIAQDKLESDEEADINMSFKVANVEGIKSNNLWLKDIETDESVKKEGNPYLKNFSSSLKKIHTPLQMCLDFLQKNLQKKDVNGFFAFHVTDLIAPGYSKVISQAMDFNSMKKKIDAGAYTFISQYKDDFQLMINNCMTYNHPDTIYHKEAKKLLNIGLKYMSKERLLQMKRDYGFMAGLTLDQLDFFVENKESHSKNNDNLSSNVINTLSCTSVNNVPMMINTNLNNYNSLDNSINNDNHNSGTNVDVNDGNIIHNEVKANMEAVPLMGLTVDLDNRLATADPSMYKPELGRFKAIPDDMQPEEILRQVQNAARNAAAKVASHNPNGRIGFLRKKEDGTTTLNFLNPDNQGIVSEKERVVNLGSLIGKLNCGTNSVIRYKEDKRNKINPVTYLNYGAFASFAPIYDSSTANVSKEISDLLFSTYGDETAIQYAKSLEYFVSNCGDYAISMVDELLNVLTNGEHSKTMALLSVQEGFNKENIYQARPLEEVFLEKESGVSSSLIKAAQQTGGTLISESSSSAAPTIILEQPSTSLSMMVNTTATTMDGGLVSSAEKLLDHTSELLLVLHQTQTERLSREHLTRVGPITPTQQEIHLANNITRELTEIIKQAHPSDLVELEELRAMMGLHFLPCSPSPIPSTIVKIIDSTQESTPNSLQSSIKSDMPSFPLETYNNLINVSSSVSELKVGLITVNNNGGVNNLLINNPSSMGVINDQLTVDRNALQFLNNSNDNQNSHTGLPYSSINLNQNSILNQDVNQNSSGINNQNTIQGSNNFSQFVEALSQNVYEDVNNLNQITSQDLLISNQNLYFNQGVNSNTNSTSNLNTTDNTVNVDQFISNDNQVNIDSDQINSFNSQVNNLNNYVNIDSNRKSIIKDTKKALNKTNILEDGLISTHNLQEQHLRPEITAKTCIIEDDDEFAHFRNK